MAKRSISLEEARAQGAKRYFTGKKCKNGHIAERQVSNKTCMECTRQKANARYAKDPTSVKKRALEWSRANPERNRARVRIWEAAHIDYVYAQRRERIKTNPYWRSSRIMRSILRRAMLACGTSKEGQSFKVLGYEPQEFIRHIERQFKKGMTWENYGDWHVDHIIPVTVMLRRGETDPSSINALPNLRPMWAKDNFRKGSTIETLL